MCGRYSIHSGPTRIRARFRLPDLLPDFPPRWNVAPSQMAPVVIEGATGRSLELARWGLIPAWVKDPSTLAHPINAKAETAANKPMFKHAFRKSRVLVPADGFYEWQQGEGSKQPYYIHAADGEPLALGGLLERWRGPAGDIATFTILTTEPNTLMRSLHNRMPAVIRPEDYDRWLDCSVVDPEQIAVMLAPAPDGMLEAYAVSKRVNAPENEGADLIDPVPDSDTGSGIS